MTMPKDLNNFLEKKEHVIDKIDKIRTEDFQSWSDTDKIKYLFETTDKSIMSCFGNSFLILLKSIGNI